MPTPEALDEAASILDRAAATTEEALGSSQGLIAHAVQGGRYPDDLDRRLAELDQRCRAVAAELARLAANCRRRARPDPAPRSSIFPDRDLDQRRRDEHGLGP